MKYSILSGGLFALSLLTAFAQKDPVDYVNPFIGTTNYGATHPGAVCPQGLMSVAPFNVMGDSLQNKYDKDSRWWSTPYEYTNRFLTGFSHVNLSGVGCPDLGSLLLMATTGGLDVDYRHYGSTYGEEQSTPGYYTATLTKYRVKCELTATLRTSMVRFIFPKGKGHILLNLGEGLTNESGASVHFVNDREIEGTKLLGTFCYNPEAVFPVYFVMRLTKVPAERGYWKKMRPMGAEAQWDNTAGRYKLYRKYTKELSGDDIGAFFTFDMQEGETIEVSMGVSFVSTDNARLNLEKEQPFGTTFDKLRAEARKRWNDDLARIRIKGGTEEQKRIFYTALYHTLLHPNILQDVSGQYPQMEGDKILTTHRNRYTVFSLWDTYRNMHQLMTILFPDRQLDMVHTMVDMYKEQGWFPKWELYGRETNTMEGDPAIPVIVDTWMKGLRSFDVDRAYKGMYKSATTPGKDNLLRPDIDDYISKGYIPLRSRYDNSVSRALEYYVADNALADFAKKLKKKEDEKLFRKRSRGYKHYYRKDVGTLCPITEDGKFYEPFDPKEGANFAPSPGFHEGNAWNYTFYVPFDIKGLAQLMGTNRFIAELQQVFDKGYYDPANEPDIAYPYLFSQFAGEGWRTQKLIKELLQKYFTDRPDGIPGNDDTGTMSAWAVFSMMGFYPDCPGVAKYTLTTPTFDEITIKLDPKYANKEQLVIRKDGDGDYIKEIRLGKRKTTDLRIDHDELINAGEIVFVTTSTLKK